MDTAVCLKVAAAHNLRPMGNDRRKVSEKIYIACLDLEDLYARAIDYRKNIEGELEEEEIETSDSDVEVEDDECVYVVRTYEYTTEKDVEYTGLWEDENGNKEFKTEDEARLQFEYASDGTRGFVSVELVKIDPTKNENRETTIDEWEDNISEYIPDEAEYIVKGWKYNRISKKVEKDGVFKTDDNDEKLTLETATELAQELAENGYGYALLRVIKIAPENDGEEEIIKEYKDDTFDPYW